jgi:pentatricopeptide repeat protein
MYAKCGSIDDASQVFSRMPARDVVSWTSLILGHVKCGEADKALELFQQMQRERVKPNPVTFVGVVNACASMLALDMGRHLMNRSLSVVMSPISLWLIASLTCMPNVGALRMQRKSSTTCPHMIWSLGMP